MTNKHDLAVKATRIFFCPRIIELECGKRIKGVIKKITICFLGVIAFIQISSRSASAWDYAGHRIVNQLALASLPANFPAFVKTPVAAERIAFLSGEPDRWRNTADHTLQHYNQPDHFIDIEYLAGFGMKPETVAPFRYDFVAALTAVRLKNPGVEPVIDPVKDVNHTQAFFGFLPWAINEYYSKLKSGFSYLKTFEQNGGTPEEIKNAQENIIYIMGVMGHYAGDSMQPLHTTKYYNGWEGPNPKGYTTRKSFHSWIDGGYFTKIGLELSDLLPQLRPARAIESANSNNEGVFKPVMAMIAAANELVEPLYQLEKDGKLSGDGTVGLEGKKFLHEQLLKGGQMLGDIWFTAWQTAPEDSYLKSQLTKRNAAK